MTTYYVDGTDGSDASAGTSVAAAWATLDKAASTVTTGPNTIYVRPGIYRETVTLDGSGSAGNTIDWIADWKGEIWPGGGIAHITASDDDDETALARTSTLVCTSRSYHTFKRMSFHWGTMPSSTDMTFTQCGFRWKASTRMNGMDTYTFTACEFLCDDGVTQVLTGAMTGVLFQDCLLHNFQLRCSTVNTVDVKNCTLVGDCIMRTDDAAVSGGEELTFSYNTIWGNLTLNNTQAGQTGIVEDYNVAMGTISRTNVTAGSNSIASSNPIIEVIDKLHGLEMGGASYGLGLGPSITRDDFCGNVRIASGVDVGGIQKRRYSWGSV